MSGIYRTNDPNQFARIDSIIIDEKAPPPSIGGVPTNVVIMAGQFERGPKELSLAIGSTGAFYEQYGDNDLFSGNLALKNKTFSSLRLIRVVASDAAKASYTLSEGAGEDAEVFTVTTIADVGGALDGLYFTFELADSSGVKTGYYAWLNVDAGGNDPLVAGRTGVPVAISTGDSADDVAAAVEAALDALTNASASAASNVVTVTAAHEYSVTDAADGDSGFTLAVTTQGNAADALTFTALYEGAYGNNISVTVATGSESVGKKYTISDGNDNAVLPDEVYDQVVIVGKTQQQINEIFAASKLVSATLVGTPTTEPLNESASLASGSNGTIADTDYEDALVYAEVERAGNLVFLDAYNATRNGYLKTHVAATQDKMCVVCGLETDGVAAAVADAVNYRDDDGRIIYGWPWVKTSINGAAVFQNPASWIASAFSQTAAHVSLAYVSTVQYYAGASDLKFKVGRNDFISLNDAGVAGLQFDPDIGIKLRNAVTTHLINDQKRPILRRRMADFLTDSIALFLKAYDNDVNSSGKRDEVKSGILDFDARLVRDGVLPGANDVKSGSPLLVDVESANTDDVVAQGKFIILYKRRLFSSMRFIVLRAEIGTGVVVTEQ